MCVVNSNAVEYTFFLSPYRTFRDSSHVGTQNKSQGIKEDGNHITAFPPNYSGRKVEINYEKKAEKLTNMWRLRWFSR